MDLGIISRARLELEIVSKYIYIRILAYAFMKKQHLMNLWTPSFIIHLANNENY